MSKIHAGDHFVDRNTGRSYFAVRPDDAFKPGAWRFSVGARPKDGEKCKEVVTYTRNMIDRYLVRKKVNETERAQPQVSTLRLYRGRKMTDHRLFRRKYPISLGNVIPLVPPQTA